MSQGRFTRRGTEAYNARFTPEQVEQYRRRFQQGKPRPTIRELADEARVAWSTMRDLVTGRTYREQSDGTY